MPSGDRGDITTTVRKRRKRGSGTEPTRSIRASDELWALIQALAEAEAVSASEFLRGLVIAHSVRRERREARVR